MIIAKSHQCPYRHEPHQNLAFVEYIDGSWCYSCNRGEFKDRAFMQSNNSQAISYDDDTVLIEETTFNIKDFSDMALSWLYKYYVFDELIRKYNIGHSQTNAGAPSLLFPILSTDNSIISYQKRYFPKGFKSSPNLKESVATFGQYNTNTIVLVEDYISAIRVGEIENSLWLIGTYLQDYVLEFIVEHYTHIKIWLDGDKPGRDGAHKIQKKLNKYYDENRAFSERKVEIIATEYDPKSYSDTEIRQILKGEQVSG